MERLVGDHGDTAVVRKVLLYFCLCLWLLRCEDKGVGCITLGELLDEIERGEDYQNMAFVFLDQHSLDERLPRPNKRAYYTLVVCAYCVEHVLLTGP